MNYAVYTYRVVDGQTVCNIVAYKMGTVNGVNGFTLMTEADAKAHALTVVGAGVTVMVLPLETDQAITAF